MLGNNDKENNEIDFERNIQKNKIKQRPNTRSY